MRIRLAAATVLALPGLALAEDVVAYDYDGAFEDAVFEVEAAIVDRGLVIDYTSHVGAMLERTREDVGGSKPLYANARVMLFCSAIHSRAVMEADPDNIAFCPYGIFVTERAADAEENAGRVRIGYRSMPEGPMQRVEELLDEIAREASGQTTGG